MTIIFPIVVNIVYIYASWIDHMNLEICSEKKSAEIMS